MMALSTPEIPYVAFTLAYGETGSNTISFSKSGSPSNPSLEYSYDNENYTTWDYTAKSIGAGDTLYIRGNIAGVSRSASSYWRFTSNNSGAKLRVFGSLAGLVSATAIPQLCFHYLFYNNKALKDASGLVFPSFELSATLARREYYYMFYGCSSLLYAPLKLEQKQISESTYGQMFEGCTNLLTTPEILATNIVSIGFSNSWAIRRLFYGCSQIKRVVCMLETAGGTDWSQNWLYGVPNTSDCVFVKSANAPANLWTLDSPSGIPQGWTVQTR